jgi:hypothetical protein
MSERALFFFIVGVGLLTTYLMLTAPELTAQDRKEMEEDWWD